MVQQYNYNKFNNINSSYIKTKFDQLNKERQTMKAIACRKSNLILNCSSERKTITLLR